MENIIDKNYFWGMISLPNMNEEEELTTLERYIAVKQKEYLQTMFGQDVASDMPEELIEILRDEDLLTSPIADFIYYHHQSDFASITTNAGEKVLVIQNSTSVLPSQKLVNAWNKMVNFNIELHEKLFSEELIIDDIDYLNDIHPFIDFSDDIFIPINSLNI